MNLTKEEIIEEINKGSEIGKQILETEIDYYKNLAINEGGKDEKEI